LASFVKAYQKGLPAGMRCGGVAPTGAGIGLGLPIEGPAGADGVAGETVEMLGEPIGAGLITVLLTAPAPAVPLGYEG
jgi:hypothetical protein